MHNQRRQCVSTTLSMNFLSVGTACSRTKNLRMLAVVTVNRAGHHSATIYASISRIVRSSILTHLVKFFLVVLNSAIEYSSRQLLDEVRFTRLPTLPLHVQPDKL